MNSNNTSDPLFKLVSSSSRKNLSTWLPSGMLELYSHCLTPPLPSNDSVYSTISLWDESTLRKKLIGQQESTFQNNQTDDDVRSYAYCDPNYKVLNPNTDFHKLFKASFVVDWFTHLEENALSASIPHDDWEKFIQGKIESEIPNRLLFCSDKTLDHISYNYPFSMIADKEQLVSILQDMYPKISFPVAQYFAILLWFHHLNRPLLNLIRVEEARSDNKKQNFNPSHKVKRGSKISATLSHIKSLRQSPNSFNNHRKFQFRKKSSATGHDSTVYDSDSSPKVASSDTQPIHTILESPHTDTPKSPITEKTFYFLTVMFPQIPAEKTFKFYSTQTIFDVCNECIALLTSEDLPVDDSSYYAIFLPKLSKFGRSSWLADSLTLEQLVQTSKLKLEDSVLRPKVQFRTKEHQKSSTPPLNYLVGIKFPLGIQKTFKVKASNLVDHLVQDCIQFLQTQNFEFKTPPVSESYGLFNPTHKRWLVSNRTIHSSYQLGSTQSVYCHPLHSEPEKDVQLLEFRFKNPVSTQISFLRNIKYPLLDPNLKIKSIIPILCQKFGIRYFGVDDSLSNDPNPSNSLSTSSMTYKKNIHHLFCSLGTDVDSLDDLVPLDMEESLGSLFPKQSFNIPSLRLFYTKAKFALHKLPKMYLVSITFSTLQVKKSFAVNPNFKVFELIQVAIRHLQVKKLPVDNDHRLYGLCLFKKNFINQIDIHFLPFNATLYELVDNNFLHLTDGYLSPLAFLRKNRIKIFVHYQNKVHTFFVDGTVPISDTIVTICHRLNISNPLDQALQLIGKADFLPDIACLFDTCQDSSHLFLIQKSMYEYTEMGFRFPPLSMSRKAGKTEKDCLFFWCSASASNSSFASSSVQSFNIAPRVFVNYILFQIWQEKKIGGDVCIGQVWIDAVELLDAKKISDGDHFNPNLFVETIHSTKPLLMENSSKFPAETLALGSSSLTSLPKTSLSLTQVDSKSSLDSNLDSNRDQTHWINSPFHPQLKQSVLRKRSIDDKDLEQQIWLHYFVGFTSKYKPNPQHFHIKSTQLEQQHNILVTHPASDTQTANLSTKKTKKYPPLPYSIMDIINRNKAARANGTLESKSFSTSKPNTPAPKSSKTTVLKEQQAVLFKRGVTGSWVQMASGPFQLRLVTFPNSGKPKKSKNNVPYLVPLIDDFDSLSINQFDSKVSIHADHADNIQQDAKPSLTTVSCRETKNLSYLITIPDCPILHLVIISPKSSTATSLSKFFEQYSMWIPNPEQKLITLAAKPGKPKRYIAAHNYMAIKRGHPIMLLNRGDNDISKVCLASGEMCYVPSSILQEIEYTDDDDWGYTGEENLPEADELADVKVINYSDRAIASGPAPPSVGYGEEFSDSSDVDTSTVEDSSDDELAEDLPIHKPSKNVSSKNTPPPTFGGPPPDDQEDESTEDDSDDSEDD